jgi:hypothetical protein
MLMLTCCSNPQKALHRCFKDTCYTKLTQHAATLQAVIYEELLQINPGSATGAYSTFTDNVQPSFVLMDLDGSKVGELS